MTTRIPLFQKDPDAVLDYAWDWSEWLEDGETITARTVTTPAGITKDSDSVVGSAVVVWLSGGTAGTDYNVAVKVTTSANRIDERTITFQVRQR